MNFINVDFPEPGFPVIQKICSSLFSHSTNPGVRFSSVGSSLQFQNGCMGSIPSSVHCTWLLMQAVVASILSTSSSLPEWMESFPSPPSWADPPSLWLRFPSIEAAVRFSFQIQSKVSLCSSPIVPYRGLLANFFRVARISDRCTSDKPTNEGHTINTSSFKG